MKNIVTFICLTLLFSFPSLGQELKTTKERTAFPISNFIVANGNKIIDINGNPIKKQSQVKKFLRKEENAEKLEITILTKEGLKEVLVITSKR